MPILSIIIPTYNSASTIAKCVESILSQTFSDFEIIIMDGVSSDNTLDTIKAYNEERIKIFSEEDTGVYDAMNKGIDNAAGKWLYFLGSDDTLYDNNVLKKIFDFIRNNDCDIIYGKAFLISKNGFHRGEFTREKLFSYSNVCHQAIFYKKNIFVHLGKYNLDFPIYADWDFNIRCASTPYLKIQYVNLPIVYYNDLSGLSNSIHDEKFYEVSSLGLLNKINHLHKQLSEVYKSKSYRIGQMVLAPFILIKKLISK